MYRRSTAMAASVFLGISAFAVPAASAAPAIPLSGGQETAAADDDGHGFFTYTLEGTTFCWTLSWQDIVTPTAAHIHVGARNVAGPIVISLDVDGVPGPDTSGCTTISTALASAISANPKAYYVNVHNAPFPAGAIRGQLK
ncbi:CHRD domain-containing protein [Kribbella sancticallisti]|uniref:CHRD domain-containing protein n=1 Tax=Kribbella sancticallisti TaxID=460087 RepID=A0ABP4P3S9_9ACTN